MFQIYLDLGFKHIADINAYDHILFIVALAAIYRPLDWKKILILVTAFTIGHSITLALAALDIIRFPGNIIEFLIPVTIFLTCVSNLYKKPGLVNPEESYFNTNMQRNYWLAIFFGLIHGMGFSNYLRSLMMPGEENQLVVQLLAFNIGIELGQLLIVVILFAIAFVVLNVLKIKQQWWAWGLSIVVGIWALKMMWDTWPF